MFNANVYAYAIMAQQRDNVMLKHFPVITDDTLMMAFWWQISIQLILKYFMLINDAELNN